VRTLGQEQQEAESLMLASAIACADFLEMQTKLQAVVRAILFKGYKDNRSAKLYLLLKEQSFVCAHVMLFAIATANSTVEMLVSIKSISKKNLGAAYLMSQLRKHILQTLFTPEKLKEFNKKRDRLFDSQSCVYGKLFNAVLFAAARAQAHALPLGSARQENKCTL